MSFNISKIAYLQPILVEQTEEYVIYSITMPNFNYYGYSLKWETSDLSTNLIDIKSWLIELNQTSFISSNNIYYSHSIKQSTNISWLINFLGIGNSDDFNEQKQRLLRINYHVDEYSDHRRGIEITSIWFDSLPIMIIMRAGRELRDETKAVVTDSIRYHKMIKYLHSLRKEPEIDYPVVNAKEPLKELSVFYNNFTEELLNKNS